MIKIVSTIAASPCCYAVVLLTKYNLYTLPDEFQRETKEKIKAMQAQYYAREDKQRDIICGFDIMKTPFLPPPEGIVHPAASFTTMSTEEFDDSISDSELASISSELLKKNKSTKSPTVVTPSKEKKRPASSSNNATQDAKEKKYDLRPPKKMKCLDL
jgi:hypothetical protein